MLLYDYFRKGYRFGTTKLHYIDGTIYSQTMDGTIIFTNLKIIIKKKKSDFLKRRGQVWSALYSFRLIFAFTDTHFDWVGPGRVFNPEPAQFYSQDRTDALLIFLVTGPHWEQGPLPHRFRLSSRHHV